MIAVVIYPGWIAELFRVLRSKASRPARLARDAVLT